VVERETLERLIEEGLSGRQIAAQLDCSLSTVRYWLARHGLRTVHAQVRALRRRGALPERFDRTCPSHGRQAFLLDATGRYRCPRCLRDAVQKRRRKVKEILVGEAGGACRLCGYAGYIGAPHFHHADPAAKRFGITQGGFTRSLEKTRREARKCILLCANCHAEVEGGVRALPSELLSGAGPADNLPAAVPGGATVARATVNR
jgi:hypothetical protein